MVTIPNITLIRSSRQLTSIYWLVLIIIILSGCGNNDNRPGDLNITPSYELDTQILEPPTLSVSSTTEFSLSTSVSHQPLGYQHLHRHLFYPKKRQNPEYLNCYQKILAVVFPVGGELPLVYHPGTKFTTCKLRYPLK